jgi:hypothetical protein
MIKKKGNHEGGKNRCYFMFLRGPLSSQKSTWFYQNYRDFPSHWNQNEVIWLWKTPKVGEHWKQWYDKNEVYWRRTSNHPDAFWNIHFRAPEVWVVRVRRPDWFWGKSIIVSQSGKTDQTTLMDCNRCIHQLEESFSSLTPNGIERLLCFVIDDTFWERVQEKWHSYCHLVQCPVIVREIDQEERKRDEETLLTARLSGVVEKVLVKWNPWEVQLWTSYGWDIPESAMKQDVTTERMKRLPERSQWESQALEFLVERASRGNIVS